MRINFRSLFNTFTARNESRLDTLMPLTREFRYRVCQHCVNTLSGLHDSYSSLLGSDPLTPFWVEVHRRLVFIEGRSIGSNLSDYGDVIEVVGNEYLARCDDGRFLDFIELIFETEAVARGAWDSTQREEFVDAINEFFRHDSLPYSLTQYAYIPEGFAEHVEGDLLPTGRSMSYRIQLPKVILRENDIIYESAVEPALRLLSNGRFASANSEFMEALEHYRERDYDDCLTKCGSAMESTMKIICEVKGWSYNQDDSFNRLLETIFRETNLDSFLKQSIIQISTLRNRFSSSHGAGAQDRTIPKHKAQFAINISAASIILLISECGLAT